MMLCKLSIKNIKKSMKDYAIYFFTLILGVAIFYVFNALGSQTVMLDVSSSAEKLIELMMTMLSGVSVFIYTRIFDYICFKIFNKKKK